MSVLFDFHHLEGLENAAYLRNVVLVVAPSKTLACSGLDSFEEVANNVYERDEAYDEVYEITCCSRSERNRNSKRRGARSSKFGSRAVRKPNTSGRWCSLAVAILRKEHGYAVSQNRRRLWRKQRREDRRLHLAQFGLEEPELMPRFERWLRSPFSEERVDRTRRCKILRRNKSYIDCLQNGHGVDTAVVPAATTEAAKNREPECPRCGCSHDFDNYGDRICWCDSCWNGCRRSPANVVKAESLVATRWDMLVAAVLEARGGIPRLSKRQLRARKLQPSPAALRRWSFLYDTEFMRVVESQRHASLLCEPPPHELTLCFQHKHAEALEDKRSSKRMRSRWSRVSLALCALHRRQCIRDELRGHVALRAIEHDGLPLSVGQSMLDLRFCCRDDWIDQGWQCHTCGRGPSEQNETTLAAQLGLDVATYRMLRELEQRDIVPEDYDLLGRLDDAVKPKTLSDKDLKQFKAMTYSAPFRSTDNATVQVLPNSNASNRQLPLHVLHHDTKDTIGNVNCFGAGFWKVPIGKLEDDDMASTMPSDCEEECSQHDSIDVCGICLVDFDDGDELRVLPCTHYFHQDCVDHWLLNAATVCPTCKHDLLHTI